MTQLNADLIAGAPVDILQASAAEHGITKAQFDWRKPHYAPIWARRMRMLARLRDPERGPQHLRAMMQHYRAGNIDQMIEDHGVTVDPRNAGTGRPILMPFVLFPRQREFIRWLWEHYVEKTDGIVVKSRDCGASWLLMAFFICLSRLFDDVTFGVGSRKEELIDNRGDPSSLFWKGRMFIKYLPRELRGQWDERKHSAHRNIRFDDRRSSIMGEAGNRIGRGGRTTMYGVDEYAFVEDSKGVDAALSANTNCRIDISTVNGLNNVFAERARSGKIDRFDFDFRDDPRKCDIVTRQMYPDFAKRVADMNSTVFNAEYLRDFMASVEGVILPQEWVQSAIGAAEKMGWPIEGVRRGSWDIADAGKDSNAFAFRHGIQLEELDEWKGQESQMMQSVYRVFDRVATHRCDELYYDKDGMGGPAGSMLEMVRDERKPTDMSTRENRMYRLLIYGFQGSGAIIDPEQLAPGTERLNKDYYQNQKAQSWMAFRWRFWNTHQAVQGLKYDPDWTISLNPGMKLLSKLTAELSQPVSKWSQTGKMIVDKTPDDVASPNLADAAMMAFCYQSPLIAWGNITGEN